MFPTPVGMDRTGRCAWLGPFGVPHARGDGPSELARGGERVVCSPRPWGWTGRKPLLGLFRPVFPTPVGMDRPVDPNEARRFGVPHARGDGPPVDDARANACLCSPRPWGWTAVTRQIAPDVGVFPTPVGMDRGRAGTSPLRSGVPHARGDGPIHVVSVATHHPCSPRPWGWTAWRYSAILDMRVFPTPVGMDRSRRGTP